MGQRTVGRPDRGHWPQTARPGSGGGGICVYPCLFDHTCPAASPSGPDHDAPRGRAGAVADRGVVSSRHSRAGLTGGCAVESSLANGESPTKAIARSLALRRRGPRNASGHPAIVPGRGTERVFFFIWIGLCWFHLATAPGRLMLLIGAIELVVGAILVARAPKRALLFLILVTHTGPVVRVQVPLLGMLTFGDAYLAMLSAGILLSFLRGARVKGGPLGKLFPILLFLWAASALLSPDLRAAAPGAIAQLQLALVYFLTLNLVETDDEAWTLLTWIGVTVLVGSCMHLVAFTQGRTLLLAMEGSADGIYALSERLETARAAIGSYFKTSFFYGSFPASCGAGIVLAIVGLAVAGRRLGRARILWALVGFSALASSLVSGNRTPILAAGAVVVPFLLWSSLRAVRTLRHRSALLPVALSILGITVGGLWLQKTILSADQLARFQVMFRYSAETSMRERLEMWRSAWDRFDQFPRELLVGLGPDVPQRGAALPQVRRLMDVGQPITVFSFHNFYLDVLFQNGVVFLAVMLGVLFWTVDRLRRRISRDGDGLAIVLLCSIWSWLLTWCVHATGWSKPVLLLAELMALSHLLVSGRLRTGLPDSAPADRVWCPRSGTGSGDR